MPEPIKLPVFFDPSQRRLRLFKYILVLALMLGMIFIFAMAVSILSVSSLADQDSILPQALVHAGPEIAHPSNPFTGNSREQLQQMVATLNNFGPTSTAQDIAVPPIDLPPES